MIVDPRLNEFDVPPSEQEARVMSWLTEAVALRHTSAEDPDGDLDHILDVNNPVEVINALRRVKQRSDRIEFLLVNARRARRRAKSTRDRVAFEAGAVHDDAMVAEGGRRLEYQSAAEKKSIAAVQSIEERRLAMQADRLVDITWEVYDAIKIIYDGLADIRRDLRSALNALQFQASLEQ